MSRLELENVRKSYGNLQVLKGVNLEMEPGEIYGLLGPNGAGKTTLFRTMMGLLKPDSGRVLLDGEEFDFSREMRSRMGYLPSEVSFYGNLTALENLEFFSGLVDADPDEEHLLELVGLGEDADRKVGRFSTGMKKRLGIAQSLIRDPDLMVYDEPTTGLDPEGKKKFRRHVERINAEKDVTVLISSHITREIEPLCDRFGILADGVIEVSGSREELAESSDRLRIHLEEQPGEIEGLDYSPVSEGVIEVETDGGSANRVLQQVMDSDCTVREVEEAGETLEDVYMRVAGE